MNCVNHTETPAVAFCRTCGKALCAACKRDVRGVIFCEDCLANRVEGSIPQGAVPPPPPPMGQPQILNPHGPNPGVAMALGFIPGVGAMYAGEFTKAVFHVLVVASLIWAASNISGLFGLGIAFWWFYMVFDSYQTAKAKQEGRPVPDPFGIAGWQTKPAVAFDSRKERFPTAAILLIGLGVLFLLGNIFQRDVISRALPLIIVYFGFVRLLAVRRATLCPCVRCQTSRMMWPAILLAFGVLLVIHQWTDLKFERTFPALLIVIGAVKLLQTTGSTEGHIEGPPPPAIATGPDSGTIAQMSAEESETRHGY